MEDYRVTSNPQTHSFLVEGSFLPGSIPVNIPDSDPNRTKFISFFLHKADIEAGIDYLRCMSMDKHPRINEGLFLAALANMMKCFQATQGDCPPRTQISENKFKKENPQICSEYERFKLWRNKHFLHDENSMTEATAFLLVAPESNEKVLGGAPSVVWNQTHIDYLVERENLERVMQVVWQYLIKEIDKTGDFLIKEYSDKTRDELLSFGEANIRLASTENPRETRKVGNDNG